MVDNITLNSGSGGAVLATDDIGGVHHQYVKLEFGAAETATIVSTSNPLPVDLRTDNLSGNLDVNIAASAATVTIADGGGTISIDDGAGSITVDGTVDTELAAALAGGDSVANPTTAPVLSFTMNYDPDTDDWQRQRAWIVDSGNSTTSTLTSASSFVGSGQDLTGYASVAITIEASHDSSTDGMMFEFSTDNTNWDDSYTFTYTAADGARRFQFPVTARFFRVNYTNGGTGQTHFRLATILHPDAILTSIHRLQDDVSPDRSAEIVKTALIARVNGSGDFIPIQANAGGILKIGGSIDSVDNGAGASAVNIQDGGNSITVDDGGGALSIDDNGTTISVDDGGGALTVDGTVAVSGTVTVDLGANNDVIAAGDVAHDTADSGNPVKVGYVARTAHPTAVADGDRVDSYADDLGRTVTYPLAPRDLITHNRLALTTTTETTLIAAGGAGVLRDIVWVMMSNESATECRVDIRDSTAGTVRLSIDLAPDGGGAVMALPVPITQATANNNWTAQLSAAVSTVYITAIAVSQN